MPLIVKIIGLAIFTYGFFGVHSNACAWAPQSCQNDKAQVSAMYMLFYYIGASTFGTINFTHPKSLKIILLLFLLFI